MHAFKLLIANGVTAKTDSVSFEVRARPVQIQTPSFTTRKSTYITAGIVLKPDGSGLDSSISSVTVTEDKGIAKTAAIANGSFLDTTAIDEGQNWIVVSTSLGKDSVLVNRIVNHTPFAVVNAQLSGNSVCWTLRQVPIRTDKHFTNFKWMDDDIYTLGLRGKTGSKVFVTKPALSGEYYYGLIAADPDGNADTTRSYFIVNSDGSITNPVIAGNPEWAKRGRIYFFFPKAASSAGTINAAALRLQYIKDLGFNIIWMMPVMKNAYPINEQGGPGYNIIDFYNVAPEYRNKSGFQKFYLAGSCPWHQSDSGCYTKSYKSFSSLVCGCARQ